MSNRLTTSLLMLAVFAMSSLAHGQSNEDKYREKLNKDFVSKANWVQSLDAAKEKAAKESKLIFAYFTRSYSP